MRVNCLDCLDRTNVVESHFAAHTLEKQLSTFGVLAKGIPSFPALRSSMTHAFHPSITLHSPTPSLPSLPLVLPHHIAHTSGPRGRGSCRSRRFARKSLR